MAEQAYTTDTRSHTSSQMPISDGHLSANGGALQGPGPPPAAGPPLGGRASTPVRGSTLLPREDGVAEANAAAPSVLGAVVIDAPSPADGGSLEGAGLTPAADSHARTGAGAGAGAGVAAAGPDHPMPAAAAPLVPPGGNIGAGPVAISLPPVQPPRGSPASQQDAGPSVATGPPPAAPLVAAPRNKQGASQPPPPADLRDDDGGAVAADAGGTSPSPFFHAAAPVPRRNTIPKKPRDNRGGPATSRGGSTAHGRHTSSASSVLGTIADAMAAHQQAPDRNIEAARRAA